MMASVVKSTPNWAALPADVPPQVVTLIQRCLEKDRRARIGDIAVARFLLSDHALLLASPTAATRVAGAAAPRWRQLMPWMLAAMLAGSLIGWLLPRRPSVAPPVTRLQMSVLPADQLVGSNVSGSVRPARTAMAISPDGRLVVFAATRGTVTQLYIRAVDRPAATPIPGTEGASAPFFSPDGAWIGFWTDNTIKKVPAGGGPSAAICDVPPGFGWGAGERTALSFLRAARASPRYLRLVERRPRSPRPMVSVICCRNCCPVGTLSFSRT